STAISDSVAERTYRVRLEGLEAIEGVDADLVRDQFDSLSTLEANRDGPANAAQIDRRAREDADLLSELLRSHGFYDAFVQTEVTTPQGGNEVVVNLRVEPGPLYHFSEVRVPGLEAAGADAEAIRAALALQPNDPVTAAAVISGEAALRAELGARGFAFAEVGPREIVVDHDTRTATLVLPVQPNGARRFGSIAVEGDPPFGARHVQRIARFDPGDRYNAEDVEDLRRALIATGLVSSATITPIDRPETGTVDFAVDLRRAPMRTIAGELGYGTGEGARAEVSWQHRNLIRPEGAVTFRGIAGTREQLIGATLRMSNFRRRDQVLTAQLSASNIDQDASDART